MGMMFGGAETVEQQYFIFNTHKRTKMQKTTQNSAVYADEPLIGTCNKMEQVETNLHEIIGFRASTDTQNRRNAK